MTWIEVTPAYGRDYSTAKAAKEAWNSDADFQDTVTGRYVNKSDAKRLGLKVILRYSNSMKVTNVS